MLSGWVHRAEIGRRAASVPPVAVAVHEMQDMGDKSYQCSIDFCSGENGILTDLIVGLPHGSWSSFDWLVLVIILMQS